MLLVQIMGGLGNQMYGYALYRKLLELGRDVYMDLSFYGHQKKNSDVSTRKYELSDVFNITERVAKISLLKFSARRLLQNLHLDFYAYHEKNLDYNPEVLDIQSGLLCGYWQSFKYSAGIENILRKEFMFKRVPSGEYAKLLDKVRNCNSVSISVRRGDYLKLGHALNVEYYINAIQYIKERIPDAKFFCVSDDIDYCKKIYSGENYDICFVKCPENNDAYDMQLISQCKHNILANSTFSIWGAWLNQNPGKIVIRPEYFTERKDFWPSEWVKI